MPVEMGRAGLALTSFLAVISGLVLLAGRPEPGTGPFVMTVLTLVVALAAAVVITLLLRRTLRSRPLPHHPKEHHE